MPASTSVSLPPTVTVLLNASKIDDRLVEPVAP